MNTLVLDPHTDAELRSLDAASEVIVDSSHRDAALNSILGEAADSPETASLLGAAPRKRPARRWVALAAAGAVAAAVAGAVVVLPRLEATQTRPAQPTDPTMVTPSDTALVRNACIEQWKPMDHYGQNLTVLLAQRRGDFVGMVLTRRTDDGRLVTVDCSASLPPGSTAATNTDAAGSTYLGMPRLGIRDFTERVDSDFGDEVDGGSLYAGEVGSDVVGVTLHIDGKTVPAMVKDGAWVAGVASKTASETRKHFDELRRQDGPPTAYPSPRLQYDVTFRDGTVKRDALSFSPESPHSGPGSLAEAGPETSP